MKKIAIFVLLFMHSLAYARWDTLESSPVEMVLYNSHNEVKENGLSEELVEMRFKILNEQGRASNAKFVYPYNGNDSEIKILEAHTIYNGEKYPVDLKELEDKPVANDGQGFDQQRQIKLPFAKVEIGAELYLKYTNKKIEAELSKYYYKTIYFATDSCWRSSHRTITSALPLYIEVNDPDNLIEVQQSYKDGIYLLDLKLKEAVCRSTALGSEIGVLSERKLPWVKVSTFKTWDEYAKQYAAKYNTVIDQQLPQLFMSILESARYEKDEIAQINLVTSAINERINYLGRWNSVKGQFVPRDLEVVAGSQNGDCKDFTAITAAILKSLGYKVQPAFVWRGEGVVSIEQSIPQTSAFNHVFLKVTKAQKIYWIDPTNMVSMAQGIFSDIANKPVLVLDAEVPSYERTPDINPNHSKSITSFDMSFQGDKLLSTDSVTLMGEYSATLAGVGLITSEEVIKDHLFRSYSGEFLKEEEKKGALLPDLKSRIVNDLTFELKYERDSRLTKTNVGQAFKITMDSIKNIANFIPNQLTDIYIGAPITKEITRHLRGVKAKSVKELNFEKNSPWLYLCRIAKYSGDDIEISDKVIIKKSFITSEELKSSEYVELKSFLQKNALEVELILDE